MTTYYVSSQIGNNNNAGTSSTSPFETLQAAANHTAPGDTVLVMNGTYTGGAGGVVLDITTSGTASAPITFKAAPGQTPIIDSSDCWHGILISASYIVVDGFTVVGNKASFTLQYALANESPGNATLDGNGITVNTSSTAVPNHIIIQNNTVYNEPGAGITALGADYVQILNNTVHDNANWSAYGASGISIGTATNSDTQPGVHITISGNTVYNNAELVPEYRANAITDGEGIILDTNPGFVGTMLVENNTIYGNGSAGIESFRTDNAVITGNILYGNNVGNVVDPSNAAIFLNQSNNVTVTNNSTANPPNPGPPPGTTADMILRHGADGRYEIYDIGGNSVLAAYQLGQVGTDWRFVTLSGFFGNDTTDMLLRNANTGGFQVYDISNNNITGSAFLGNVGLNWQVTGFGNFSSLGENDMILRNAGTGGLQVYDIRNNQITGTAFLGTVGLNWQTAGVSNHGTQSDLVLRDSGTGGLMIYNIINNQITGASFLGTVGLDWQVSGFGDFSSRNEGDMLLRNVNTGGLMLYDIANNQITGAFFLGNVGLDWRYAGVAPIHGPGTSDLVLRNVNNGAFEVYDIANNQLTGAAPLGSVGLDWQLGGFAVDPPTAPAGGSDGSTSQLVQAMAGFTDSSGAGESLNTAPLGADTSQQTLLTTPQHA
jgi:hypothetical protein